VIKLKAEEDLKPQPSHHNFINTAATMDDSDSEGAAIVKEIWAQAAKRKAKEKKKSRSMHGTHPSSFSNRSINHLPSRQLPEAIH
jgi:hypothetical protein